MEERTQLDTLKNYCNDTVNHLKGLKEKGIETLSGFDKNIQAKEGELKALKEKIGEYYSEAISSDSVPPFKLIEEQGKLETIISFQKEMKERFLASEEIQAKEVIAILDELTRLYKEACKEAEAEVIELLTEAMKIYRKVSEVQQRANGEIVPLLYSLYKQKAVKENNSVKYVLSKPITALNNDLFITGPLLDEARKRAFVKE